VVKGILQKAASPPHVDGIPYTLQWAAPFSLEIAPFNGIISIGSAVLAGLTTATEREINQQTDHANSVYNNRPNSCP